MGALADRVISGDRRAAARLMRLLDDEVPSAIDELKVLYPRTGRAYILGITGSPGSGKSTLVDQIVRQYRGAGKTVGVVAIDPTSPFSGGAILGDRIRMGRHELDDDVFVRSLATRGNLGGLSRSTRNVVHVMDAMGCDIVIIETVGVGQDEVDIVGAAHTSLVVLVPGMGDDIQAIKAGILEIADIFVINKSDREGADRTEREIALMLEMTSPAPHGWRPPIVRTVASRGDGLDKLVSEIARHREHMERHGILDERKRRTAEITFWESVRHQLTRRAEAEVGAGGPKHNLLEQLAAHTIDPYTAAEEVVRALVGK